MGEKVEDLALLMRADGKDGDYILLISCLAGILNRREENKIKSQPGLTAGYRMAIEDMTTQSFDPPNRQKAEEMVSEDLKRMRAANKEDAEKRKAEMKEWG